MGADALTIVDSDNSVLEFSVDGKATWKEVPFVGSVEASGGETPSSEVVTFKRVGKVTGKDRLPSFTFSVPSFVPQHSSWKTLRENRAERIWMRIRTKEQLVATSTAGNTAAIADTGVVSLDPLVIDTPGHSIDWRTELYGIGLGIKIGTSIYIVDTISDVGVLTVSPVPSAAIAAMIYTVVVPSLGIGDGMFGRVTGLDTFSLTGESNLTKSFGFEPAVALEDWKIQS